MRIKLPFSNLFVHYVTFYHGLDEDNRMGMELVEISLCLETEFDVRIDSDDWMELVEDGDLTVGALFDFVMLRRSQQEYARDSFSSNEAMWNEIRISTAQVQGLPEQDIRMSSPLRWIFVEPIDTRAWRQLEEKSDFRWPRLCWPRWVETLAIVVHFTVVSMILFFFWPFIVTSGALILLYAVICSLVFRFVDPYVRNRLPRNLSTMKDLCRHIRDHNLSRVESTGLGDVNGSSDDWKHFRTCLVDILGVDDDEVVRNARLVADLGCD